MNKNYLFLLALLVVSCGKREIETYNPEDIAAQQRYFPLSLNGTPLVYQVDSLVYDFPIGSSKTIDSTTCFISEIARDTFRGPDGGLVYRIERQMRQSDTMPWVFDRFWSAELTRTQAIRTEDNLRFLRLVFPLDRRSEWDGNLWIDDQQEIMVRGETMRPFTGWRYEVDSVDVPRAVGVFQFDSTLVVTEVDETNIIERRYSKSVYAKGIGLVYKEQWILDSQYCNQVPPPGDCETKPWLEKAERGYVYRMKLVSF